MTQSLHKTYLAVFAWLAISSAAQAQWLHSNHEAVVSVQIGGGATRLLSLESLTNLHGCPYRTFRFDHAAQANEILLVAMQARALRAPVTIWSTGCTAVGYQSLDAIVIEPSLED